MGVGGGALDKFSCLVFVLFIYFILAEIVFQARIPPPMMRSKTVKVRWANEKKCSRALSEHSS